MASDPLIGQVVVGHVIEGVVGEGGMGTVYRARHARLGRVRALKLLPPRFAEDESYRERFEREWRSAAAIEHPNIVEVLDAGDIDGQLFIVMRLIDGPDLGKLLTEEGPLGPLRALSLLSQVADALDAANERGLVHRDVKPSNILVGPGDTAYLTDFGVAKNTGTRGLTQKGMFVGTIDYAAPEQIEGRSLDGRTDVYGLGGVLYTCLTGAVPYERESEVQVIYAHLRDPPPAPSSRHPELTPALDAVVAKAMDKSRENRYGSCGELIAGLRAALRVEETEPRLERDQSEPTTIDNGPVYSPPEPPPPPPPWATPSQIDFRILGPLEVVGESGPIPLAGQRQRALLGLLLLRANEVIATERLVDLLYGEEPPRTATTSLHNTISQLRKLLGPELLVTRPRGYVLKIDREQLDLARFERLVAEARVTEPPERAAKLREALALWRGPPLADLAYETFAQAEIRRLEDLRLAALEERIDADVALGRHDESIGELETVIAEHPLRERPRGLLMLALYRSGRQGEALHAYHDARRVLVEELGIEPGPALQQLHAAILRQERSLHPAAAAASPEDHYTEVVKALLASRLVPVLGPGAVFCGRPENSAWEKALTTFVPGEEEVASHLAREFGFPTNHGLPHVSQIVAVTRGLGPLYDELHYIYGRDYPPGPVHSLLVSLPPLLRARGQPCQLIVTTSYDTTVERAFRAAGEEIEVVSYIAAGRDRGKFLHLAADGSARVVHEANLETQITTDERTILLKLHGGVDQDPRRERESFVVREDDYIDYLAGTEASAAIPVSLVAKLRRSHFLFLGYALDEWSPRVFLRRLWGEERVAYRSWAVQSEPDPIAVEYWRQRGVDAFDVSLDEYVAELGRRVEEAIAREVSA